MINSLKQRLSLCLFILPSIVFGQSSFTNEQLEEIENLLVKEREIIRAQLIEEFGIPDVTENVDSAIQENSDSTDLLSNNDKKQLVSNGLPLSKLFLEKLGSSTLDRNAEIESRGFEFNTSTENSRASIKLTRQLSTTKEDDKKAAFKTFSLVASAPLSKTPNNLTNISSLDGFANSSELSLKFSKYLPGKLRRPVDEDGEFLSRFEEICEFVGIDIDIESCDSNKVKEGLIKKDRLDLYSEFQALFWDPGATKIFYGGEFKLGYENLSFINGDSLESESQDETPWAAGIYGGFIPPGKFALFSAGLEYQKTYKLPNAKTVCPTNSEMANLECVTGNIGSINEKEKYLASLEGRTEIKGVGLSLKVTHDLNNHETGVDLPIYFLRDADDILNGGIRFGWTDTDDYSAGVFIGSSFEIFQ